MQNINITIKQFAIVATISVVTISVVMLQQGPKGDGPVDGAYVDGSYHLIISAQGNDYDAGYVRGAAGPQGLPGPAGPNQVTGLITAGANVSITGAGTLNSPYIINSSGGGGSMVYPGAVVGGDVHPVVFVPACRRSCFSGCLGLKPADFGANLFVSGVLAHIVQVGVFVHCFEIAVSEVDGGMEGFQGQFQLAGERVAAGEVVLDDGIAGAQPGQALVNFQPFGVVAAAGVIIAQYLQGLNVSRVAADDAFKKKNLQVQVLQFPACQFIAWTVDFLRHSTQSMSCSQVGGDVEFF